MDDDFPRRRARSRGFRLGQPRTPLIAADGHRVLFLRSAGAGEPVHDLWAAELADGHWSERLLVAAAALLAGAHEELTDEERARRERLRETSAGITDFTVDEAGRFAAFLLSGRLWLHDVAGGETRPLPAEGCSTAALDPTGRSVAVTQGPAVALVDVAGGACRPLLTPDGEAVSWGSAEFIAAEELDRHRGLWWAPDGETLLVARVDEAPVRQWWLSDPARPDVAVRAVRYPAAGTPNARVSLHLVDRHGARTPVATPAFEYLAAVQWHDGDPVVAVLNRRQDELLVLGVDPATGACRELGAERDPAWVELVPGLPRRTPGGIAMARVDRGSDTRRLVVVGDSGTRRVATPAGLQVRAVSGHDDDGIVFTACEQDPSTVDVWRLRYDGKVIRLSEPGGWSAGHQRGGTTVIARADADSSGTVLSIRRPGAVDHRLRSLAEPPGLAIRPRFLADAAGWRHIAVLWPTDPVAGRLPILMSPYGGPHAQRSIQAAGSFATEQWLADQGFCVVVADGPGAPSRPSNERQLHRDLATGSLTGQIAALARVTAEFGDRVDPARVGIRGWSFGGYLAALGVLTRSDLFHAAVAGAPVTEWELYDTAYTERYLGLPSEHADAYRTSSLLGRAAGLHRPLLLIHGLADDNVVAAHTLRLSQALLVAGRPHQVLPLSGVTHMTPQEAVAENLLRLELDFLTRALRPGE